MARSQKRLSPTGLPQAFDACAIWFKWWLKKANKYQETGFEMRKSVVKNAQAGFTLIELVVVIVILGILSATALPRFLGASQSARIAAMQGIQGSLNSSIAISRAQALITGGTPVSVSLDGGVTVALFGGFPDSTAAGIGSAMNFSSTSVAFTPGAATSAATAKWQDSNATTPANCKVTYTAATSTGAAVAATVSPSVAIITSGC
jgi:MSHA pilin protein MshA